MTSTDPLLGDLLRRVSRSFHLSLAILPRSLREPVGLAYLLARLADTVADTSLLARAERLAHLETLRRAYQGERVDVATITRAVAPHPSHTAERQLLEEAGAAVARLEALPEGDRGHVRHVLATITSGMIFDLTRFAGQDAATLTALETLEDLDRYTYLVAGCVGEFWTALHLAHRPRLRPWDRERMSAAGVRFGKALQMTNVLRDIPSDLRHGRCYLPAHELAPLGLGPADLLDPGRSPRVRPLLARLLAVALGHYDVAWDYTLAIPRAEWRMRLACVWPLMIGHETLAAIAACPDPLAAPAPIKIPRARVRAILARSAVTVWSNSALRADAARLRARVP